MLKYFSRRKERTKLPFIVDVHSHLLPGIDDGVKSVEESIYILRIFQELGYKKLITTPHVMSDSFPNTPEKIFSRLQDVQKSMKVHGLTIEIEAAAEYYLDESFMDRISKPERLLTFGENFLLFETSFFNKPFFLEEAIFNLNANGYNPVLAHPERYGYLQNDPKLIEKLKSMNLIFQMNLLSLAGYYSSEVKKFAKQLLKLNMIDLVGTDCHNALQANEIIDKINGKNVRLLQAKKLLNSELTHK